MGSPVRVDGEDGFLVTGTHGSGDAIEVTGAGTRMFFNPLKGAFRAGRVFANQWNNANIGDYSTAMGVNTTASGDYSTAMGQNTIASGDYSTAMGNATNALGGNSTAMGDGTTASGINSTAMGENNHASGSYSTAMGVNTIASGDYSTAMGFTSQAQGSRSTAMGNNTTASGFMSTAMGSNTTASGSISTAMGNNTIASGEQSTAIGIGNESFSWGEVALGTFSTTYVPANISAHNTSDRVLTVGNGVNVGNESNALTILKNGNAGFGNNASIPTNLLHLNNGLIDPLRMENVVVDATIDTVLVIDPLGVVHKTHIDDIGSGGSATDADWFTDGTTAAPGAIGDNIFTQGNVEIRNSGSVTRPAYQINSDNWLWRGSAGALNTFVGNTQNTTNTGDQNTAVGYAALRDNTSGGWNTALGTSALEQNLTGATNTAVGYAALRFNTSGSENTAIGYNALTGNITGNNNTALGIQALNSSANGNNNVAIGKDVFYQLTTGNSNVALGMGAGGQQTSGDNNVYLGHEAGASSAAHTKSGNVNIGYRAGFGYNTDNRLFIENSNNTTTPLIYGEFDNDILRTNAEFQINDPAVTGYRFPTADGAANEILQTDGNGTLSWVAAGGGGGGGTLDQAYDEGGAGAGRTIDAVDGAVRINGEDGLIVTGTLGSGDAIEVTGSGTRMFFNPLKAAFRAGTVSGTQWDNANIGNYSVAMGENTRASGNNSTAMGRSSIASGNYSTAMGLSSQAQGVRSTAMGWSGVASGYVATSMGAGTTASGDYSTAMGNSTDAIGDYSTAMGNNTSALGNFSTVMGTATTASGSHSTAMGENTTASGSRSTAMGLENEAFSYGETVIGTYSTNYAPNSVNSIIANDRLFVVGNGTATSSRSNALTMLKNGTTIINGIESDNTNNRTFFVNGSAGGTGAWFNDSDRRYKKNIEPLQSALDKVLQIEGVSYEWDNQNYPNRNYEKGTHIGFIAQDLEKVVPEVVNTASGEAGYKSVAYAPLTALLVEAVKEQQTQIDSDKEELEQQLENQQQTINQQQTAIDVQNQTINQQQAAIDEQNQTIENQQKLIEQMMEQLQSINQKLEGND